MATTLVYLNVFRISTDLEYALGFGQQHYVLAKHAEILKNESATKFASRFRFLMRY